MEAQGPAEAGMTGWILWVVEKIQEGVWETRLGYAGFVTLTGHFNLSESQLPHP